MTQRDNTPDPRGQPDPRKIWVISACRFCEAVSIGMLVPVLPTFIGTLETPLIDRLWRPGAVRPEELTAVLFSLTGFSMAGIQLLSGRLADAFDRRKALIVGGLLGGLACTLSFLVVSSYGQLLGARILQGICFGLTFPALMAMVAFHAPEGRGGRVLGLFSTFRLIGFGVGPLLGGWITAEWGRDSMFVSSAVLLAISIAMIAIFVPDCRERNPGTPRPRKLARIDRRFYIHGAVIFLMMVGISAVISYFPYYQSELGATERELGLVYGVFIVTRCIFQFPAGYIGDRFDKKNVLLVSLVLFIPVVGLVGFVTSLGELLWLRLALGALAAGITASLAGMSAERSTPGTRARVMSVNTMAFSLGVAVGPLGGFFVRWSYSTPFVIAAAGGVVVLLLVWFCLPSDREFAAERLDQPVPSTPIHQAAPVIRRAT